MHKKDLALHDQQWLICHQTKPKIKTLILYKRVQNKTVNKCLHKKCKYEWRMNAVPN